MKCRDVRAWFLINRAGGPQPGPVGRHLRRCRRCRRLRRRLGCLEHRTLALPEPPDPDGLSRTLLALKEAPAPETSPAPPRPTRRRLRLLARLVTLAAGVLLGYLMARWNAQDAIPPTEPPPAPFVTGRHGPEVALVGRLVEHDLELAAAADPAARVQTLTQMAAALREEALRVAAKGPQEQLPLLARLHDSVLRRGVLGRLRALPPADRARLQSALLGSLRAADAELTAAAPTVSAAAAHCLEPLGAEVRELLDVLENNRDLPPESDPGPLTISPEDGSPLRSLLAVLVSQGLLLAEEDNPVRRASFCNDLADQLTLTSLTYSLRGDHERAWQLSKQIEKVVDRGLAANLARIQQQDPQDPRLRELERIIERSRRTLEALEKDLSLSAHGDSSTPRYAQTRDLEKDLKDLAKSLKELGKDPKEKDKGKKDRKKK
jgi:hypothetical protein